MFRMLILLLALTLAPFTGLAEAPFTFAEDLTGVYTWPEEASEADASYVYRFTYPQIVGEEGVALTINEVFRYEASYALDFDCPMNGSSHPAEEGQMQVDVTYEVVHLSDAYLSVRIDKVVDVAGQAVQVTKAFTFTLTGSNAGTVTSLPYLTGQLDPEETDEWLVERQTDKADACAREMVWALIEKDMAREGSAIYEDMTFEDFQWSFYPEEDFFLNEDGDLVFFLQEGSIAPPKAGMFLYTITMEDMLDEL